VIPERDEEAGWSDTSRDRKRPTPPPVVPAEDIIDIDDVWEDLENSLDDEEPPTAPVVRG
jgi:hypothetical protein